MGDRRDVTSDDVNEFSSYGGHNNDEYQHEHVEEIQYHEDGTSALPSSTARQGTTEGTRGNLVNNLYGCGPSDFDTCGRRFNDSGLILKAACANWKSFKFFVILWIFIILVCSLAVFGEFRRAYNHLDARSNRMSSWRKRRRRCNLRGNRKR